MEGDRKFSIEVGLSLLELMIFCAILSLIAAISIPSTYKPSQRRALKEEAAKLQFAIENLNLNTRQTESPGEIFITSTGFEIQSKTPTQLSHGRHEFKPPILATNAPLKINFYSSGVTSPTTVVLSADDLHCEIKISLRSRVRTECSW